MFTAQQLRMLLPRGPHTTAGSKRATAINYPSDRALKKGARNSMSNRVVVRPTVRNLQPQPTQFIAQYTLRKYPKISSIFTV
jgi:hypothetical protein